MLIFLAIFYQSILMNSCTVKNLQEHTNKSIVKQTPEIMNLTKNHFLFIHLALGNFDPLSGSGPPVLEPELTITNYPDKQAGYYLLQFKGPILQEWKDSVISTGAHLFDYIPQFAFIVKMDEQAYKNIQTLPSVRWIGIYQPGYRLSPSLISKTSENARQSLEVIALLFPDEDTTFIQNELKNLGAEIISISEKKDRIKLRLQGSMINTVARMNGIKFIESVSPFKLY